MIEGFPDRLRAAERETRIVKTLPEEFKGSLPTAEEIEAGIGAKIPMEISAAVGLATGLP